MYEDDLLRPWYEHAMGCVPGAELYDVHAHTGQNDPDGYRLSGEELVAEFDVVGASGVVIPMAEPEGYRYANDRVLAEAEASGGRLAAFCRIDPMRQPLSELARCYEAGARGIKLHPRAEGFTLSAPMIETIVAFAHDRRLPVLVHAGRGIPTLAADALRLAERYPDARIILGHAGICDLNWVWREVPRCPNLFFDLSWWQPSDLLALMALVPPGQLLWASDLPYFTPILTATFTIRFGLQVGLTPEQVAEILGRQGRRLVAGEEPADLGPAPGPGRTGSPIQLERIASWLSIAVGRMVLGDTGYEALALARLACDLGDPDDPDADVCRNVLRILELQERYATEHEPTFSATYPGIYAAMLAACVARTPAVPLPDIAELRGQREISEASAAGHRVIDVTELPSPSQEVVRDLRRSSAADHLVVDPSPRRPGISGIQQVPEVDR